jgi:hypothetical protein
MNAALVGIGLFMALLGQFLGDGLLDGLFLLVLIYLPVACIAELWLLWQRISPDLFKPVGLTEPRPSSSMLLPISGLTPKLPPTSALPQLTVRISAADCSQPRPSGRLFA